ncbi:hypothetical protein KKA20_01630 [Patescibacteria group bacterium]|nr:hypothetical protein [Patescibacteria group bacterium]
MDLNKNTTEYFNKLNIIEIINNLLNQLKRREAIILKRRFGLNNKNKETLERISTDYGLSRERIRQIESASIGKLNKLTRLKGHLNGATKIINELLQEHGGILETEYLHQLFNSAVNKGKQNANYMHKNNLDFLLSKLLNNNLESINNSKNFKHFYKLKNQTINHLEKLAEELLEKIQTAEKLFKTEELINLCIASDRYKKHQEKFNHPRQIDVSKTVNSGLFKDNINVINNNKALYSILVASNTIGQNKFGHWGLYDWPEIQPKTTNHKINLILKHYQKPLHFTEIAKRINKINFDNKRVNIGTVHNELMLDNKYILVGKGIYGLKEK